MYFVVIGTVIAVISAYFANVSRKPAVRALGVCAYILGLAVIFCGVVQSHGGWEASKVSATALPQR